MMKRTLPWVLVLAIVVIAAGRAHAQDDLVLMGPLSGIAMGKPGAPLILVEFTDIECPMCRKFHVETFDQLVREYVVPGKVLFMHRDLPRKRHPNAVPAARAVRCAAEQGRFWQLRHVLLVNGERLGKDFILGAAAGLGLEMKEFEACFTSQQFQAEIDRDLLEASQAGISRTPTFVLGRMTPSGFEGVMLVGIQSFETLSAKIKEMLREP